MSIIDIIFNLGPDAKETILKGGIVRETENRSKEVNPKSLIIEQ
jgi:hypothetical protein